jgi:hypothetical protein
MNAIIQRLPASVRKQQVGAALDEFGAWCDLEWDQGFS